MNRFALIVDDDISARRYLMLALAAAGFETRRATSGESAILLLPTVPQGALVVIDMLLGDCTGDQLADYVNEARPDLRVLRVTGTSAGELLARDEPVLHKPVNPHTLQQTALSIIA